MPVQVLGQPSRAVYSQQFNRYAWCKVVGTRLVYMTGAELKAARKAMGLNLILNHVLIW